MTPYRYEHRYEPPNTYHEVSWLDAILTGLIVGATVACVVYGLLL